MNATDTEPTDTPAVIVRCQNDPTARIRFSDRYSPDGFETGFAVDLHADGLQAHLDSVVVWAWGPEPLADFLDKLAADFRGWEGERTWSTHHLALRAVFRSGGHVGLTWTLQPWTTRDDSWEASATTWLEGGEQMTALAAEVRCFLDRGNTPGAPACSR
ncbi:DUF6228 family protein [Kitasatospora sp. NPDC101155]|uniref:DUF6228 family protein n=1 Tax=Kitasatospora sp. NPDC101155 TaxID=3364097 RepID=UPI00380337DC